MRIIFGEMMTFDDSDSSTDNQANDDGGSSRNLPTHLRTGIQNIPTNHNEEERNAPTSSYTETFLQTAERKFTEKGFAFYAKELAELTLEASRIVRLALYVH